MAKALKKRIGVLDFETDPFKRGRDVRPFCWGVKWDDGEYAEGWGDDAVETLAAYLNEQTERAIVYAHNGGRFDFVFLSPFTLGDALVLDGRIVRSTIGNVELRDSYLILPHALSDVGLKIGINYKRFTRGRRERYRKEIQKYLWQDCDTLLEQVIKFRARFGNSLTVSSAATIALNKIHRREHGRTIARLSLDADVFFRQFYFGGRTEAYEKGVLRDDWKMYDVRSMFASTMRDFKHPTGSEYLVAHDLCEHTDFAIVDATSKGALPFRLKNGAVDFPKGRGTFHASGHELHAGVAAGTIQIHKIISAFEFTRRESFREFVTEFGQERMRAIDAGDHTAAQHFKNILVRSYGKQSLNIHEMESWRIAPDLNFISQAEIDALKEEGFAPGYGGDGVSFWRRPLTWIEKTRMVRHVACGASITAAARVRLGEALPRADRPAYCDTDGIICRHLDIPEIHDIGGWRQIDQGNLIAIHSKKTYALFDGIGPRKWASKGGNLTPDEILRACQGETIVWDNQAPTFSIASKDGQYISRTFKGLVQ